MAVIERYYPGFVSGMESQSVEFASIEELLNIPWVKNFKKDIRFYRFSVSHHPKDEQEIFEAYFLNQSNESIPSLIAEYMNGWRWWVVGHIYSGDEIIKQLPVWEAKKEPIHIET